MAFTISTLFLFSILFTTTYAATFDIHNNCPYTVWAAASPGGGAQLGTGQTWTIQVPAGTPGGRVWPRTGCSFDGSGHGHCITGDCGGLLQCQGWGQAPNTLAEYTLNGYQNLDFIDISLIQGFNVPMDFSPSSGGCRGIRCASDVLGQCPGNLRVAGGCSNPCTTNGNCPASDGAYFKRMCPDAYSWPHDDATSTFTCPGGTNYRVTFCP